MAALSAVVFTLSGWLGLYLLSRDPRKPVLVLAAVGLCGFALVVALDAVRTASVPQLGVLSRLEIYLVALPSVAWFAVLIELARPSDHWRARTGEVLLIGVVGALTLVAAMMAGSVDGPLRPGHVLMFAAISISTLGAMLAALVRRTAQPVPRGPRGLGLVVVATLFFALGNAILIIPLGLLPSWLALASTGFDVLLLGVAVALWDAFDEGQALRGHVALVHRVLGGGGAVRWPGVNRFDADPRRVHCAKRTDGAVVHHAGGRDCGAGAGRSAGRGAGPAGVLEIAHPAS